MKVKRQAIACSSVLLVCTVSFSQSRVMPDPEITAEIAGIRVIDNHCHPEQVLVEGETDTQWDGFPQDAYQTPRVVNIPANIRPKNAKVLAAWRALWGISDETWSEDAVKRALAAKRQIKKDKGDAYPAWVLDRAGVEIALSNRVTMQRGLSAPRFRWVTYADMFMFPLSTAKLQLANSSYAKFYGSLEQKAKELRSGKASPQTLAMWLKTYVVAAIEQRKQEGAVALKFTAAYYRPLDFAPVPEQEAASIYLRCIREGGGPNLEDYKKLQDYIFFEVGKTAARLHLPVHIHTGPGSGAQYSLSGANPFLLEKAINGLPDTDFVLLHGGWPFSFQATALLMKSNVFIDFSGQEFMLSPRDLADVLRYWMDYMPEKVLFGTDAFPNPSLPQAAWEEFEWLNAQNARQALAIALTTMRDDGQITTGRAKELARMVLRENAAKLHRL